MKEKDEFPINAVEAAGSDDKKDQDETSRHESGGGGDVSQSRDNAGGRDASQDGAASMGDSGAKELVAGNQAEATGANAANPQEDAKDDKGADEKAGEVPAKERETNSVTKQKGNNVIKPSLDETRKIFSVDTASLIGLLKSIHDKIQSEDAKNDAKNDAKTHEDAPLDGEAAEGEDSKMITCGLDLFMKPKDGEEPNGGVETKDGSKADSKLESKTQSEGERGEETPSQAAQSLEARAPFDKEDLARKTKAAFVKAESSMFVNGNGTGRFEMESELADKASPTKAPTATDGEDANAQPAAQAGTEDGAKEAARFAIPSRCEIVEPGKENANAKKIEVTSATLTKGPIRIEISIKKDFKRKKDDGVKKIGLSEDLLKPMLRFNPIEKLGEIPTRLGEKNDVPNDLVKSISGHGKDYYNSDYYKKLDTALSPGWRFKVSAYPDINWIDRNYSMKLNPLLILAGRLYAVDLEAINRAHYQLQHSPMHVDGQEVVNNLKTIKRFEHINNSDDLDKLIFDLLSKKYEEDFEFHITPKDCDEVETKPQSGIEKLMEERGVEMPKKITNEEMELDDYYDEEFYYEDGFDDFESDFFKEDEVEDGDEFDDDGYADEDGYDDEGYDDGEGLDGEPFEDDIEGEDDDDKPTQPLPPMDALDFQRSLERYEIAKEYFETTGDKKGTMKLINLHDIFDEMLGEGYSERIKKFEERRKVQMRGEFSLKHAKRSNEEFERAKKEGARKAPAKSGKPLFSFEEYLTQRQVYKSQRNDKEGG